MIFIQSKQKQIESMIQSQAGVIAKEKNIGIVMNKWQFQPAPLILQMKYWLKSTAALPKPLLPSPSEVICRKQQVNWHRS